MFVDDTVGGYGYTGRAGCGKSTLLELSYCLFQPPVGPTTIHCEDMSDCLKWGREHLTSDLAKKLQASSALQQQGTLVPSPLVIYATGERISHVRREHPNIRTFGFAGWPRDHMQERAARQMFAANLVIYVDVPPEVARGSIFERNLRLPPDKRRSDDATEEIVETREKGFMAHTLPMVERLLDAGEAVRVSRDMPIPLQLVTILHFMLDMATPPVGVKLIENALIGLDNEDHPVHDLIEKIIHRTSTAAMSASVAV